MLFYCQMLFSNCVLTYKYLNIHTRNFYIVYKKYKSNQKLWKSITTAFENKSVQKQIKTWIKCTILFYTPKRLKSIKLYLKLRDVPTPWIIDFFLLPIAIIIIIRFAGVGTIK